MIVYRLTCIPTGKVYIGITTQPLSTRLSGHISASRNLASPGASRPIMRALRKHPLSTWVTEIIGEASTWEELCLLEMELIARHRANDPRYGYNASSGGEGVVPGFRPSPSTIASRTGWHKTPEQIERSASFHRGRKRTHETKKKMSASRSKWWGRLAAGEVTHRPDPKINWNRNAAICVAHFELRSYERAGSQFGITGPAAYAAVLRVRRRIEDALSAANRTFQGHAVPAPLHPSWIEFALSEI